MGKLKKADAVFCGDLHLSFKTPIARTDNYSEAMWTKFEFINQLALDNNCPVLCSGDFLDHWKASPELLSVIIEKTTAEWFSIYGDHDLPNHSLKLKHKSGLTTLQKAGKVTLVKGGDGSNKFRNELPKKVRPIIIQDKKILLWHVMTWNKELPYPGCTASNAKQLLKKYPQFDCIVTGDNHKPFVVEYKGRLLVNVGSMLRSSADQITYKPSVWLYYAKTNSVVPVQLPIKEGVISREHIEIQNERNERIDAFISKIKTDFKLSMNFKDNLIKFFDKNKTKKKVKELILKHTDNE